MDDLVKRLRERDKYTRCVVGEHRTLVAEAADEIERQREALRIGQAALEAALNQVSGLTDEVSEQARVNGMGMQREAALMAQVAALREALEKMRDYARHRDWCDLSRNAGYAYGDDIEALYREHPCDCGFGTVVDSVLADTAAVVDAKWPKEEDAK